MQTKKIVHPKKDRLVELLVIIIATLLLIKKKNHCNFIMNYVYLSRPFYVNLGTSRARGHINWDP